MVGGTIRFSEGKGAEVRKVRKGSRKGGVVSSDGETTRVITCTSLPKAP